MSAAVDVGRHVIASRQMKMVAGITRDVECKIAKHSFDSAAKSAEEVRINVAIHLSIAAAWKTVLLNVPTQ